MTEHDDFCNCEECVWARGEEICPCCGCYVSSCTPDEPEELKYVIGEEDESGCNGPLLVRRTPTPQG